MQTNEKQGSTRLSGDSSRVTEQPGQTGPRFVSAAELRSLISVTQAVDALERGFRARDPEQVDGIPRSVLSAPDRPKGDEAEVLLMPAFGPEGAGLKLITIVGANGARGLPLIQGLYVLLTRDGLTPELVIDGAALTALRTSAVSALATQHLARPDSHRLVVFGAGPQAAAHITAMRAVLPIDHVTVVRRTPTSVRADALVTSLRAGGVDAAIGRPEAIANADVICTCTTSARPVFSDDMIPPGVHVNAVGAYRHDMAELPAPTLARGLLVVESVEATLAEAGDVVAAINCQAISTESIHTVHEVLSGSVRRSSPEQVTIFKSVGLSIEDLIVARAVAKILQMRSL